MVVSLQLVVPARAGVFPRSPPTSSTQSGRPRPRGGVPTPATAPRNLFVSSPPARGCSWPGRVAHLRVTVVPARAGVFRICRTVAGGLARRPRPRGGVPATVLLRSASLLSSPPARGCSLRSAGRVPGPEVVPARAGVFRTPRGAAATRRSRPRPRGGVPCRIISTYVGATSSPPARGCSDGARAMGRPPAVVPARAGVFRPRGAARPCSRGRPRPRGGVPPGSGSAVDLAVSSPPARGCSADCR